MNTPELTGHRAAARSSAMGITRRVWIMLSAVGLATIGGCININAPSEPIVIELNINIRQEVIYRLAADVEENIDANPDIF